MWNTFKRLFNSDAARNFVGQADDDLSKLSEPELVSMNQELGRAQDAMRDKRREISREIARRNAIVHGQVVTSDAKV